jgi:hypothetical protein
MRIWRAIVAGFWAGWYESLPARYRTQVVELKVQGEDDAEALEQVQEFIERMAEAEELRHRFRGMN